jgi:hypothetical protein
MNVLHPAGIDGATLGEEVEGISKSSATHELFGEFRVGRKVLGLCPHVRVRARAAGVEPAETNFFSLLVSCGGDHLR